MKNRNTKSKYFPSLLSVTFFIFFILTFISLTSAVEYGYDSDVGSVNNLGSVRAGDCITLPQSCDCSSANISTIMYPNKSFVYVDKIMTKNGSYFNYTFCDTQTLGEYIVNGIGQDANGTEEPEPFNYAFDVTTTGNDRDLTMPIFLGVIAVILFVLALITRNLYLGFISGIVFIVLGIYSMIFGLGSMSDFYTRTISYISLGLGLIVFLSAAFEAISDTQVTLWRNEGIENLDDGF